MDAGRRCPYAALVTDDLSQYKARKILEDAGEPKPGPLTGLRATMTGAELRAWRLGRGFSQHDAAQWLNAKLGTKYGIQQISNWENGAVVRGKVRGVPGRVVVAVTAGK